MAKRFNIEAIFKGVDKMSAPVAKMTRGVGNLTKRMELGLRRVDRATKNLGRSISTNFKRAMAIGTLAAGAFAVALNGVAEEGDALAKQARRLQFPIEELQTWKFVANQAGVSNELLDKSLGAFSKRLGEAKAGLGPLASQLKRTNPELLKQLTSTDSIAEAFDIYIKAMRGAANATDQAAMASAAFSRAGLQMVDITKLSEDQIAKLTAEQLKNGVITMKQAEAAEAYNDAVGSLKASMRGLMRDALIPIAPILTDLAKRSREWILANKADILDKIERGFKMIGSGLSFLYKHGKTIAKVTAWILGLVVALKTLILVMTAVNLVMGANPIVLIVLAITAAIAGLVFAIRWVIKNFDKLKDSFKSIPAPFKIAIAGMMGPVGWFLTAAILIKKHWGGIKAFFNDLWDFVVGKYEWAITTITGLMEKFMGVMDRMKGSLDYVTSGGIIDDTKWLINHKFGGDDRDDAPAPTPPAQMVSPQSRTATEINERNATSSAEVTIRDETGRAELTSGRLGPGLNMIHTGAFA